MLKKRLIPVMLLDGGRLHKTVGFGPGRDVGDPVKSAQVYSDQFADELVFLNITRAERRPDSMIALLHRVSEVCFMPISVGGGIRSLEDARILIQGGADKVVVNSSAYANPDLIRSIADEFGTQAVIVGVDCRRTVGGWSCWSDCGRSEEDVALVEHLNHVVVAGAGEILVQSIDEDGRMNGYDIELLDHVAQAVDVPVIGCGGAGHYDHLRDAFLESTVAALAMGSLFNFTDSNPIRAKASLTNYGIQFKVV